MEIRSETTRGKKRRLIVELDADEHLVAFRADDFYKLGYPLDDEVVRGDNLIDATPVTWCVVSQKWVE